MLKSNLLTSVHHIAIICSDYKRSKHFYTEVLGFKIIREIYREELKSYKLDLEINADIQIELFSFIDPPKRISYPEACGLRHLAFNVLNIDAVVDYLNIYGIICEPVRIDKYTNKRFTFFKDPDDLPLEIYEI